MELAPGMAVTDHIPSGVVGAPSPADNGERYYDLRRVEADKLTDRLWDRITVVRIIRVFTS